MSTKSNRKATLRGTTTKSNANASNCVLCTEKDSVDMVVCQKCNKSYHFRCAGVDGSGSLLNWICQRCKDPLRDNKTSTSKKPSMEQAMSSTTPVNIPPPINVRTTANIQNPTNVQPPTGVETPTNIQYPSDAQSKVNIGRSKSNVSISIPSSASSKRRSVLQLEKLAKEKAIQRELIEAKAKLDSEYLQKEYSIRENASDYGDDELPVDPTERSEYVTDWLNTSELTTVPTDPHQPISDPSLPKTLEATSEQIFEKISGQTMSRPTSVLSDLALIPPKHIQFAHPLVTDTPSQQREDTLALTDGQTLPLANLELQSTILTSRRNQDEPTLQDVRDSSDDETLKARTSTNEYDVMNARAYQSGTGPPPFIVDLINHQPPIPVSARFAPPTDRIQTNMPSTAQHSTSVTNSMRQSLPNDSLHQPNVSEFIAQPQHQPIFGQQSFAPITSVTQQPPIVMPGTSQRSTVPISMTQQPPSTYYQPYVPVSNHQPPIAAPVISQQSFIPISVVPQPSNTYYQPYVPVSNYQPPITTPVISQYQPTPNITQQSMGGPNATLNMSGFGHQLVPMYGLGNASNMNGTGLQQSSLNQWVTYDPQLNPQQLQPSRLQLAARQTMPRDYPKFNGDPGKWSIFLNAYVNGTTTCGLSNGENLSRLEKCLEDPARKAIKNLLTRPESVPDIIETLKMLYGRPEANIDAQINKIKNEPPPKMHKMETFIDFSMSVRNVASEIQKSGMWQYLWNPQLLQELVDKLPYQMRMDWGLIKMSSPNVNLSNFSDWLYMRAQTACAVTLPSAEKKSNTPNSNGHVNAHSNGDNNSNKKTSNDNPKHSTNSNDKNCQVCKKSSHNTDECRKFIGMSLNDKWESVKNNKICRICLGKHHVLQCESGALCGESGCTIKHHRLLHNPTKTTTSATGNNSASNNVHSSDHQNQFVILRRYIPVTLYGPKGSLDVIAFLDEGSDTTLVEHWIPQKLGISGEQEDLYLTWTAKIVRKEPNSQSVTMKISGTQTKTHQYEIKDARTVKSLNLPSQTVDMVRLRNDFKFLRRIPIESYFDRTPKILIGLRDCKLSTPLKTRSGGWDEPVATKTRLGWEVHGANTPSAQVANLNFHNNTSEDADLHQLVAQFFSLENFGVKKPEQTVEALSDIRARQLLESTTKRTGTRFETGLLWKYDDFSLPNSLPMAKRRLESLEKRLKKDPDLAVLFRNKFSEYVEKGYVRKLSTEEIATTDERTWYLPLFPVTYPKKPGKIRLVWDAAAKVGNISLNSMLLSGPDLLVSLPGVLFRFREHRFVVTGDIREMFHQIGIRKEDQMAQRFLWRDKDSSETDVYVLPVMSFGATCSPSSAQYIKNYNASELSGQYPRAEEAIHKNTYVDDWLQSFTTEAEAVQVAREVKYVHERGGFEIRNWLSNSSQVSRALGASSEVEQKLSFDSEESQQERILGMWWTVKQDTFTYSLRFNPLNKDILFGARRPTKREVLRTLMTIYDPLGFLAHYLVQLKMIIQDIWRSGIGWDEQIKQKDDDNLYARWLEWLKHLPEIERISINRHYSDKINATRPTKIELHIFVDAGELAYSTVAYFRIDDQTSVDIALIGGKTKVAPLNPLTVPRMELQAAVLGARFKNSIVQNHTLQIARTVFWSDSSTVLGWLRSDLRRYTQFVGARVNEILETTTLSEWRWVPSELNPADDATKYKDSFNLDMNSRWFKGPDFLRQTEDKWPTDRKKPYETSEELRPRYINVHNQTEMEKLPIKFEEFHQWKRTMAFVFRFVNNVKAKLRKPGFIARYGLLKREELRNGETFLYRKAQLDVFAPEIHKLELKELDSKGRRTSVDKTSPIYRYSPYLDQENVLRMRGRIDSMTNISMDQKRPIILPTNHQITEMVVKEYHILYEHQYTETVINEIKQKFIIGRLRALFKRIRRNCQHCKNGSVQPIPPEMARLPEARLATFTRPFTFTGLDYAGPYKVIANRKTVKVWIVLFTCLTIRAVYIDVVDTLTTDSCIMAIRRFIARNGTPREFFSDRGTSFIGANNELQREREKIDHDLLNTTFTSCYTQWNFIPPYSQHMGGAWERLIGSMKNTLDKILPQSHYPNHETFVTALAEVENIINSRPLTFVSIEPDDQEALTPNHFLKGSSNGNKPPGIFPALPKTLRGNWKYSQQIANEFWTKWVKEYLPMITRRTKWFDDVKPIEVGDQVIVVDENAPRNMWDRGVVVEAVSTGQDGRISRVNVRTTDGIYTRPVTKLAVLDLAGPETKSLTRETLAGVVSPPAMTNRWP